MIRAFVTLAIASILLPKASIAAAAEIDLKYHPPGDLFVGIGRNDRTIYFPGIAFPLAVGPRAGASQAFANSQIGISP